MWIPFFPLSWGLWGGLSLEEKLKSPRAYLSSKWQNAMISDQQDDYINSRKEGMFIFSKISLWLRMPSSAFLSVGSPFTALDLGFIYSSAVSREPSAYFNYVHTCPDPSLSMKCSLTDLAPIFPHLSSTSLRHRGSGERRPVICVPTSHP